MKWFFPSHQFISVGHFGFSCFPSVLFMIIMILWLSSVVVTTFLHVHRTCNFYKHDTKTFSTLFFYTYIINESYHITLVCTMVSSFYFTASAVCTVFGDPHYRTFDGRMYSFQGTCKYMLTQDCLGKSFSIKVRNDARTSSKFSWTKMLVINLGNTRISLHPKLVTRVDRKRVKLPFTNHAEFSVVRDGRSLVFKSNTGLKVVWDGESFVEVSVPSRYRRKLCGLCGNFNGLGTDDMRGKDGRLYFNGEEFGHSWRVGSRGACHIRPEVQDVQSKCTEKPELKIRARKECSLLLSVVFSKCRKRLDVRPYYK